MREVFVRSPDCVTTFEEFPDGTCEGRYYSRIGGLWRPPLPTDLELPAGFERNLLLRSEHEPVARGAHTTFERPAWLLGQNEDWRL